MTTRGKQLLLAGLGGCWVLVALVRWLSQTEPQEVPLRFKSGQQPGLVAKGVSVADEFDVKPLKPPGRDSPADPKKNIFTMNRSAQVPLAEKPVRVRTKEASSAAPPPVVTAVPAPAAPEPPPPPPVSVGPTPEELAAQAEQAARRQREMLMKQAQEQMAQYRYFGYAHRNGRHQAFLIKGNEIHILQEGDKLDGKFAVSAIDAATVTLREYHTNAEGRIELKKDQPIGPS